MASDALAGSRISTRTWLVGALFVVATLALGPLLNVTDPPATLQHNPSLLEARSLLTGTTVLPERLHDTALYEGRAQNVFQPGQTFLFLVQLLVVGDSALEFWRLELFGIFVLTSALFAMALYHLAGGRAVIAAALGASMMFGAPYLASLPTALAGSVYRTNHVVAIAFMAAAFLVIGTRGVRGSPFLVGACIAGAMLFRAQSALLLIAPLCCLFQDASGQSWSFCARLGSPQERKLLARDLSRLLAAPVLVLIVVMGFQYARFQNPLEDGYRYIYEGRTDLLAERAREFGVWSTHFLPDNLWRTLFLLPAIEFSGPRIVRIAGDPFGNSLLFSQPLLLLGFLEWRGLATPRVQAFALATLAMAVPALTYHNPGFQAPGYMRYSLDYLPAAIATIAIAWKTLSTRSWLEIAAGVLGLWSVYYAVVLVSTG